MRDLSKMSVPEMLGEGFICQCGKRHATDVEQVHIGPGMIEKLPQVLKSLGKSHPYMVCDPNTWQAAGQRVDALLTKEGFEHTVCRLRDSFPEPDEKTLGQAAMHFDKDCDIIVAVGSGVINDTCKMLSMISGRRSIIVGTAPSMDGFSSNSSSMMVDGVKTTIYDPCPVAILLDTDVLCKAPMRMLQAGLGDILAKYVALCDWKLAHLINGDYYCENIASLMRRALGTIRSLAPRLPQRDPETVARVGEGLVMSAITMSFAGSSRPASGLEHYFSHMWEMFDVEKGIRADLHGIQVGVGTLLSLKIYEWLRQIKPDRARAEKMMREFDPDKWEADVRRRFGSTADNIIAIEQKTRKNDPERHARHLDIICSHWDDILGFMDQELPPFTEVYDLMKSLNMPMTPQEIGFTPEDTREAFMGARDIRDKYLCCSMIWEMGLLDEIGDKLKAYVEAGCPREWN